MKYVFLITVILLVAAGLLTWSLEPDLRSEKPVLHWVTDPNPARVEQVRLFHQWLERHDYPRCELRLDTANADTRKKLIQGVSGVAGDVMDVSGGGGMRFFQAVGMLTDITEEARQLRFDPSQTYTAMESEITLDGRQYMFPCNVPVWLYWVNKETFRKYGCPPPPRRMDIETFEKLGKAFVAAANKSGERRTAFFCNLIRPDCLRRSLGVSMFNETLTRCTLDDERAIRTWQLLRKWTYEDHLMPTPAENQSFAAAAGYGGSVLQLFNNGNYAMFTMGRYALIQLRQFGQLELAVCEPPHGGFPNCFATTRAAAIYGRSKHPECTKYFLAYLASEEYNMQIVRDADALPPNPTYTETEAFCRPLPLLPDDLERIFAYSATEIDLFNDFKRSFYAVTDNLNRDGMLKDQKTGRLGQFVSTLPVPPRSKSMTEDLYQQRVGEFRQTYADLIIQYQNEWGCHEMFSEAAKTIAIGRSYSPFVVPATTHRIENEEFAAYMAGVCSAEEAARSATQRINDEMQRNLPENAKLRKQYEELCRLQEEIDRKRADDEPVPLEDIKNPFHRRYYVYMGWAR